MIATGARRDRAQFLLFPCVLLCALICSSHSAEGAITFVAPALTLPQSSLVQTGSFEIYVASTASPEPSVGDFQVTLDLPNQQNVTFVGGAEPSSAAHPFIFGPSGFFNAMPANSGDTIEGTGFTLATGGVTLFDGAGLMRVDYSIAPNFVGTLPLTFETNPSASSLSDAQGNALSLSFLNGSLSVVPEPNAAMLAAMGFMLSGLPLLRSVRRRRANSR